MRVPSAAILSLLAAFPAWPEERMLEGDEIRALLPTIMARGNGSEQLFSATGETTFSDQGRDSVGRWTVEGDRYCSFWPPNQSKACYAIGFEEAPPDGGAATIIWIDAAGERTINVIADKEAPQ